MKRKLFVTFFTALFALLLLCPIAFANSTPPVSVDISFEGMEGRHCFVTLLSEEPVTGSKGFFHSLSAWDGDEESISFYDVEGGRDIWEVFQDYKDPDGFHFLQVVRESTQGRRVVWSYYPPSQYKILVYFPDTDSFVSSNIIIREGFETRWIATLTDEGLLTVRDADAWGSALVVRMTRTVIIEVLFALLFGYWGWKRIGFIALVNVVTQLLLNIGMYGVLPKIETTFAMVALYVVVEVLVLVVESAVYLWKLPDPDGEKQNPGKLVGYVVIANLVSFLVGL